MSLQRHRSFAFGVFMYQALKSIKIPDKKQFSLRDVRFALKYSIHQIFQFPRDQLRLHLPN